MINTTLSNTVVLFDSKAGLRFSIFHVKLYKQFIMCIRLRKVWLKDRDFKGVEGNMLWFHKYFEDLNGL